MNNVKNFDAVPYNNSMMSQQNPPLIVKISSSLSTAISDCA